MNKVIIFVLGAAAGSLVTWKIVEEKYKRLADEEIADVVEYYKNKDKKEDKEMKVVEHYVEHNELDNTITEYKHQVSDLGYIEEGTVITEPGVDYIAPYVIAPEEFGEMEGYDTKSWTYYEDFVLTDEVGEIIAEPESIIGDALAHFGEYEEDSVYARNENTECDYEILKHDKTFSEINKEDN